MLRRILLAALLAPASALADAGEGPALCEQDAALTRAAAELALTGATPDGPGIAVAVREAGSDLVGVRARVEPAGAGGLAAFVARRARMADAALVCGQASSESGELLLVAARAGTLEPLTTSSTHVRGDLRDGFEHPQLVVADGYGELQRLPISRAQLRAGIPIAPDIARPARVQLVAAGPAGPRPVAERVLPAFDGPHGSDAPALASSVPESVEVAPWQRLTQLRSRAGLGVLRAHRLLAEVAQEHAERVCASGRVAHTLDPGHDPEQRLKDRGVVARLVGETVSRAADPGAAFSAFETSPSHRMTLLERSFTDAGIGHAHDKDHACVVVLLAAWPRFVGR